MELHFCMTYVEWRKSGEWSPNVAVEANWMKLAAHLNKEWSKQYAWSVYHSKFMRMKKIWRLYVKLKGLRHSAETGIGWDENKRCFLTDDSQWNNLQLKGMQVIKKTKGRETRKREMKTFLASRKTKITSTSVIPNVLTSMLYSRRFWMVKLPQEVLRQARGVYSHGHMSQQYGDDNDNSWLDDTLNQGTKWASKRPASSQGGTNSFQGSQGSKSSRNSDNPFVECAASLTNLALAKLKNYEGQTIDANKYDVTMAAKVVESFEDVPMAKQVAALQKF